MSRGQPLQMLWWLVSRASGIVALVLISVSVLIGLAMAAKVLQRPKLKRGAVRLHEHLALTALAAIAIHGLALLGDHWLKPGWRGITIPFALSYRPGFTGIGIIAGYLAVLLGPSFYLRRRIGARRWRRLHRATAVVWLLSAVHALGAGTDGATLWLRVIVVAPLAPIVYLLVVRLFGTERTPARPADRRPRPVAPHRDRRLDQLEVALERSSAARPGGYPAPSP
jgi:sulfoxide reductase heme-binding subunit YedZ